MSPSPLRTTIPAVSGSGLAPALQSRHEWATTENLLIPRPLTMMPSLAPPALLFVNTDFGVFPLPPYATAGAEKSTRAQHVSMLYMFQEAITALGVTSAPLDVALVLAMEHLKEARDLKWSTINGYVGSLLGAWARLSQYHVREVPALDRYSLTSSSVFRDANRYLGKMSRQETVQFPRAITPDVMRQLLRRLRGGEGRPPRSGLHALAAIMWFTACRPSDALQLDKSSVTLDTASGRMSVRFMKGKGVTLRKQPFTINTSLPVGQATLTHLSAWLRRQPEGPLFAHTTRASRDRWGVDLRTELREVDGPEATIRGCRRGSLQTLAANPSITEADMLEFSNHADARTLRRYLSYGAAEEVAARTVAAAATLALE